MTDEQVVDGEAKELVAELSETKERRTLSLLEVKEIAAVFVASGLFKDTADQAKAIVKIMAGNELGIGPFAAMRGFNIIQGQLAPAANLLGALIKASEKYDYRVTESNAQKCHIEFFDGGIKIGDSEYTTEDAQLAGLSGKDNWRKYPRQMLYARALSEGARMHCPDVFMGSVYVPEELGADVVDGEFSTDLTIAPDATTKPQDAKIEPKPIGNKAQRPLAPERLKEFMLKKAEKIGDVDMADGIPGLVTGTLNTIFNGSDLDRHSFLKWLFGVASSKLLHNAEILALYQWLDIRDGLPSTFSLQEARMALAEILKSEGQKELPSAG